MHIGKSYKLPEFILWTRRKIYLLALFNAVPVTLYEGAGVEWLAIPWGVAWLLGTTVALSAGFKNVQTYNRMQEAQRVWCAIASASRIWGAMCRDLVADPLRVEALVDRHLAWLAALRHEMRAPRNWETADKPYNVEYRRHFRIPERDQPLASELARLVAPAEAERVLAARNKPLQVLALQSQETKSLLVGNAVTAAGFSDLQDMISRFRGLQGQSEGIKDFPYPRQHAFINTLFVRILCVLLPFSMIGEFERLNQVVEGWAAGRMVWFAIPLGLLISWMYISLDQVGESTENPFEGSANDVPITRICQEIESDLRDMLGQSPAPLPEPGGHIVM